MSIALCQVEIHRVSLSELFGVIPSTLLQKPPLPIAALYRQVQRLAPDLGEKTPSYGTVFNIVRGLPVAFYTSPVVASPGLLRREIVKSRRPAAFATQ